jgi:aryl-phospho-beta-D-glucosidase BglC (GH1 family)
VRIQVCLVGAREHHIDCHAGWNLGNSLDAIPDETSWGNPLVDSNIFDDVAKAGFKSVRVPGNVPI